MYSRSHFTQPHERKHGASYVIKLSQYDPCVLTLGFSSKTQRVISQVL